MSINYALSRVYIKYIDSHIYEITMTYMTIKKIS